MCFFITMAMEFPDQQSMEKSGCSTRWVPRGRGKGGVEGRDGVEVKGRGEGGMKGRRETGDQRPDLYCDIGLFYKDHNFVPLKFLW